MNIFELMAFVCIFVGAGFAYHFTAPFGQTWAILAAIVGAVAGAFIGPLLAHLFFLPFEGAARLFRFITTGRWTDPRSMPSAKKNEEENKPDRAH